MQQQDASFLIYQGDSIMAKRFFEQYSLATNLQIYLNSTLSWSIGEVQRGFQVEFTVRPPLVAIHFLPSKYIELQLGRSPNTDKSFERRIQIDCYMEDEPRATAIADDVGEFLDELFIEIKNPADATLGYLSVPDSESIILDVLNPRMSDPTSIRWRGIVQATLQADYIV